MMVFEMLLLLVYSQAVIKLDIKKSKYVIGLVGESEFLAIALVLWHVWTKELKKF